MIRSVRMLRLLAVATFLCLTIHAHPAVLAMEEAMSPAYTHSLAVPTVDSGHGDPWMKAQEEEQAHVPSGESPFEDQATLQTRTRPGGRSRASRRRSNTSSTEFYPDGYSRPTWSPRKVHYLTPAILLTITALASWLFLARRSQARKHPAEEPVAVQKLPSEVTREDASTETPQLSEAAEIKKPEAAEIKTSEAAEIKTSEAAEIKKPEAAEIKKPEAKKPEALGQAIHVALGAVGALMTLAVAAATALAKAVQQLAGQAKRLITYQTFVTISQVVVLSLLAVMPFLLRDPAISMRSFISEHPFQATLPILSLLGLTSLLMRIIWEKPKPNWAAAAGVLVQHGRARDQKELKTRIGQALQLIAGAEEQKTTGNPESLEHVHPLQLRDFRIGSYLTALWLGSAARISKLAHPDLNNEMQRLLKLSNALRKLSMVSPVPNAEFVGGAGC